MLHYQPPMHKSGLHFPSTPISSHHQRSSPAGSHYRPLNSSPLASPSTPKVSPEVAARRRSQFKSRTPSTPVPPSSRSYTREHACVVSSSGGSVFGSGGGVGVIPVAEDPQKAFLREKFKARCFERAARARAKAVRGKRYLSEASSDGFEEAMDDDDEEDDDAIMHDELFRRIMENANRKDKHSFRVSYAHEVGSSFDPDMENVEEWEQDLFASGEPSSQPSSSKPPEDLTPVDLDDEELEAYAEECARRAALADFEDIPQEELFSLSDVEELVETPRDGLENDEDVEMMH
ncbi:hypothetical protein FPV67DRAFT_1494298, partial [Lyophyllum atratum]